jgi:hypothetical protein
LQEFEMTVQVTNTIDAIDYISRTLWVTEPLAREIYFSGGPRYNDPGFLAHDWHQQMQLMSRVERERRVAELFEGAEVV